MYVLLKPYERDFEGKPLGKPGVRRPASATHY